MLLIVSFQMLELCFNPLDVCSQVVGVLLLVVLLWWRWCAVHGCCVWGDLSLHLPKLSVGSSLLAVSVVAVSVCACVRACLNM